VRFREIVVTLILFGIVMLSLFYFVWALGEYYGISESTLTEENLNLTGLTTRMEKTSTEAKSMQSIFKTSNPLVAVGGLVFKGVFSAVRISFDMAAGFFEIMMVSGQRVFGIPPFITGSFMAIIIITIIFVAWNAARGKQD